MDDLLGQMNFGDMAFLQLTGKMPTPQQSTVFNALLVCLVEHGITPSALAARMTYAGAPESLQAAVASGLCGLGSVFVGSMENAARMLSEALPVGAPNQDLDEIADALVNSYLADGRALPGLGHPIHKPVDPRAPRLFEIAAANGYSGPYVALMSKICVAAESTYARSLPVNATGAIAAISCEMGFPWKIVRGFGVMARAVGLVGHILEESEDPMALEIWHRIEDEVAPPA